MDYIIKNGDPFLTGSESFFGFAIRALLWRPHDKAPFNHVAGAIEPDKIIEALGKIAENPVTNYFSNDKKWAIVIRRKGITDEQRQQLADEAKKYVGKLYPYHKIGLQFLDNIFRLESRPFSRYLSWSKRPYCSELWAVIYYKVLGIEINGVHWKTCTPDDWFEELKNNLDKWEIVYQYNIGIML